MSRRAAGNGIAVLEGVGLDAATIRACFANYPRNVEDAIQTGLTKWTGGEGIQPPTWDVLLIAMEYAGIAQQHLQDLMEDLARPH